jgi:hypothetical protein
MGSRKVVEWYLDNEETLDLFSEQSLPGQRGLTSFDGCELGIKREGMSGNPPSSGTLTYVLSGA